MKSAAEKAAAFRALHERPGAFVIPNPWDAGTARLLAALGFEALATTSLGLANSLGRVDGTNAVTRAEVLEKVATPLASVLTGPKLESTLPVVGLVWNTSVTGWPAEATALP